MPHGALPASYKICDGSTNYVLRSVVDDVLPKEITCRKNELGCEAPEKTWIADHEQGMKSEIVNSHVLAEIADKNRFIEEF